MSTSAEPHARIGRRPRAQPHRRGRIVFGVALAGVLCLVALEILLRLAFPAPSRHYVWPPHLRVDFEPSEAATPGVSGVGRFRTNSLGLRSDELPAGAEQVIYVLGGSTAIDLFLDQDETWVQLLQAKLNRLPGYPRTWIGNLARASLATIHNLLHLDRLLPELPRGHLLLNLVGVNDLQLALKSSYLEEMTETTHLRWAFALMPPGDSLANQLASVRLTRQALATWRATRLGIVQTRGADGYARWRECRQAAPPDRIVDGLPALGPALTEYRENLARLLDRARAYGVPMVLLSQPTLWAEEMGPAERGRLLAGGLGPNRTWCAERRYYSPRALAAGMDAFNDVVRAVCRARGVACIDLAAAVPKRAEYFYDDMHFSEAGARLASDLVLAALRARWPHGAAPR